MKDEILLHAGGNAVIYFLGNYFNFVFYDCLVFVQFKDIVETLNGGVTKVR